MSAQLDSREKHREIFDLLKSLESYSKIPATFDGEVEEVAFGKAQKRYLIGNYYELPDSKHETTFNAMLKDATVNEQESSVYLVFETLNGDVIFRDDLTSSELEAYRQHPHTFFGVIKNKNGQINTPLEIYDFLYQAYKDTTKENLLRFMKNSSKLKELEILDREALINLYCQHMTASILKSRDA